MSGADGMNRRRRSGQDANRACGPPRTTRRNRPGGIEVLAGHREGAVTREKPAVHAGFWLKPDRLAGGEIRPVNPSQTFSQYPARTDLDEGMFAALEDRNGTSAPFSLVKRPIKHNGH